MYIGEEYYCEYLSGTRIRTEVSRIAAIGPKLVRLENGKKFIKDTGEQLKTEKLKIWKSAENCNITEFKKHKEANEARRWFQKMLDTDEIAINLFRNAANKTSIDRRKPFNLATEEEIKAMKEQSIKFIKSNYKSPEWCGHPNPFSGCFGCEPMLMGAKIRKNICFERCRFYVPTQKHEIFHRLRSLAGLTQAQMNVFLDIVDYQDIESGNRDATAREISMLEYVFGMEEWTLEQVRFFLQSIVKGKDDPFINEYGKFIKERLNYGKQKQNGI